MNAVSLNYYLERLPADVALDGEDRSPGPSTDDKLGLPVERLREIERYATIYASPRAVWLLLLAYARKKLPLPPPCDDGDDAWLRQAYSWMRHGTIDPYVSRAVMLTQGSMSYERGVIEALLLTAESTVESVARHLALSTETVACYEQLFFNVIDRRHEALYIGRNVYPETRLVELFEGYLRHESLGNLLKRAGFNNGVQHVLHAAGLASGSGLLGEMNGSQAAADLESLLMANGYFLARNGWLNQQQHAQGLTAARGLISAAKMSGQAGAGTQSLFAQHGVGASIRADLISMGQRRPGGPDAPERPLKMAELVPT